MKIIELLTLIAKGEEVPKKIKWRNKKYILRSDLEWYILENGNFDDSLPIRVIFLNDEVEIIEEKEIEKKIEKKIEKIIISMDDVSMPYVTNNKYQKLSYSEVDLLFASKINELIDIINDMRDKE